MSESLFLSSVFLSLWGLSHWLSSVQTTLCLHQTSYRCPQCCPCKVLTKSLIQTPALHKTKSVRLTKARQNEMKMRSQSRLKHSLWSQMEWVWLNCCILWHHKSNELKMGWFWRVNGIIHNLSHPTSNALDDLGIIYVGAAGGSVPTVFRQPCCPACMKSS